MFLLSTVQTILCIVLITLVLFVIISGVTIVPKDKVYIVERLGVYHNTWKKGIYFRLIGVEKIRDKVPITLQNYTKTFVNDSDSLEYIIDFEYYIQNYLNYSYKKTLIFELLHSICQEYINNTKGNIDNDQFLKVLKQNDDLLDLDFINLTVSIKIKEEER